MRITKIVAAWLLMVVFCHQTRAQGIFTIVKTTSRTYTGRIGQQSVRMNLFLANGQVSGAYVYAGIETPMELTGTLSGNHLDITAAPPKNYPGDASQNNGYVGNGTISGTLDGNGNISGTLHLESNGKSYELDLNKVFEVMYMDSSMKAAFINHNPDYKTDTVYTLWLKEAHFENLPYRKKMKYVNFWYSYPFISVMYDNHYTSLNDVGDVKLEDYGFFDGDYLLQQKKTFRHTQFPYHYRNEYSVAYIDPHLLSMRSDIYVYDGASHPFTSQTYKNYDLVTGDSLKLDSLFLRGGKTYLDSVGEICFRKKLGIGPNADLLTLGFYWNDSMFHVNTNFYFTTSGICFVYNRYEIADYDAGLISFIIPYDMLKPIIWKGGPLGWVFKE